MPIAAGSPPLMYSLGVTKRLFWVRYQEHSNGKDKVLALQRKMEDKQQTRETFQVVARAMITVTHDDG